MNVVQPHHCQPSSNDLEPPSVEMVEKLKAIMDFVAVPAGLPQLKPDEFKEIKEFACNLPVSRGFNPTTLHLLHRLVVSQFVGGAATTTVNWPMLERAWTEICERGNRQHLVAGLPMLLNWCFETNNIRVIGLCEMEWDAHNRQIVLRANQPNYDRMADYLKATFNPEAGEQSPAS